MRIKRLSGTLGLLILTITLVFTTASASEDLPEVPTLPVQTSGEITDDLQGDFGVQSKVIIPGLKAVLIVGPIDGDFGDWTQQEKQNMDLAAASLAGNGVEVHKFYAPNNSWNEIKAAAQGAHFLFYRGHGVSWGSASPINVGGFALSGEFVSPDKIRNELNLAENAIVMLYGCYTAGTSSSDYPQSISLVEARRRVAQYSDPFLDAGAGGYYANWFGGAFETYVDYLFSGMSLGEAYESYFDFNPTTVNKFAHPEYTDLAMWLDSDYWSEMTQYNNAFVGQSSHTLQDLFSRTEMEINPTDISYWAQPDFDDYSLSVQVESTGSFFSWIALEPEESWLILGNDQGLSGDQLALDIVMPPSVGTYETDIVVYTDDPGVVNNHQTIHVSLEIQQEVYTVFIPGIGN